jgi:hypothetical protein
MAVQITLTDGATTIQLNSGAILSLSPGYEMATPVVDETVLRNLGDGDTIGAPTWGNVTETIPLLITGANAAAVVASIQGIERLLDVARQNRLTWNAKRVWLTVQFDQDAGSWRSEVLAGRLVVAQLPDQIWRNRVEASLIVTRRYFWEGALTALELSSGPTGTPTTDWVTVYNADDLNGINRNWFHVAAAQVGGTLPSPLKLEIRNNSGLARSATTVHLSNYVFMDPTTVDPILRGEEAVGGATGTWGTSAETLTHRWLLTAGQIADLNGQYARIIMAPSTPPVKAATLLRAALLIDTTGAGPLVVLASGEQVLRGATGTLDLGVLPIPPGGAGVINGNLYLAIYGQVAGGDTLIVDWVQLMASGEGLYRRIQTVNQGGWNIPNGDVLTDDGPEGVVYVTESGTRLSIYRGVHKPLHVWPGVTQRMRLMIAAQGAMVPGTVWQVKASYRPRRLTV